MVSHHTTTYATVTPLPMAIFRRRDWSNDTITRSIVRLFVRSYSFVWDRAPIASL